MAAVRRARRRRVAVRQDQRVPQHRRRRFHRHLDFDWVAGRALHLPELDADKTRHRALLASSACAACVTASPSTPSATSIAMLARLDAGPPGRASSDSAGDVLHFRLRRALAAPWAAAAAAPCRGRPPRACASSSATLRSCATTRSRTASVCTLVSSKRNARMMCVFLDVALAVPRKASPGCSVRQTSRACRGPCALPSAAGNDMKPLHAGLERTAAAERIRLVRDAPARNRLPVHAVALVVVHLRDRRVDRNLVKIGPAQPR